MDPNAEIDFDFSPFLIRYKSGRIDRLMGTSKIAACTDAATGVPSKDVVIEADTGLAARLYLPKDVPEGKKLPVLVYFHGGAFVTHSAFSPTHYRYLNSLVAAAEILAVSVDYRLAPEHPLPTAYDDSWAALNWAVSNCMSGPETWLAEHGDITSLFVAGDSAGGNIAHNMAMRAGMEGLHGGARIKGMALLHPYFRGKEPVASEGKGPEFRRRVERSWSFICAGKYGIDHPFIDPLAMPAEEWAKLGCERALVTVAVLDTLSDRGRKYADALRGSAWKGEEVVLYETEGEGHVYYLSKSGRNEKAAKEMEAVVSFITGS